MKKIILHVCLVATVVLLIAATKDKKSILTANFTTGDPGIASMNSLSFGPEGILFVGDSKNAMIYALDTKDITAKEKSERIGMNKFDETVAASLGTTADNIRITDMAVNPVSKIPYFSVHTKNGTPVLLKLVDKKLVNVSLKNISYSKSSLTDAVAVDAKDKRGRALRQWAVADLKYHNGKVMVSGLSNKEFASTFRSIPFPFTNKQDYASLEIYHAAHGRYETYAPIKAFDVVTIESKEYLLASYTCTPLVLFSMEDMKNGKHLKGRTIAELGAGNSPLDIINFTQNGDLKFFMSNTNRPIMRMTFKDIAAFKESLTTPVTEFGKATGLKYDNLPFVNVIQLDDLDQENALMLRRRSNGDLYLHSRNKKWM
ncbi:MAG: hypothetical protein JXQ93_10270 [Flavobacteriaceae bacterium]